MPVNTFPAPEVYRDPKRWAWWFSLGVPALIGLGPLLMLWQGDPLMLLWPLVFLYLAVPLADALLGEERSNPPESAVAQLEADAYYRFITYALVPVL
jgi:alkane 1-monooxygenase